MPKQFLDLCGKTVLCHTLHAFREVLPQSHIVTVISQQMAEIWKEKCNRDGIKQGPIAFGGETRWESVKNGLTALGHIDSNAIILVHDGVRPLVTPQFINEVVNSIISTDVDGVIPTIPLTDSIRHICDDGINSIPVDRTRFRAVQTPQAFRAGKLEKAFNLQYSPTFTDEASMMAAAGFKNILLINGQEQNIKITRPVDLIIAAHFLTSVD